MFWIIAFQMLQKHPVLVPKFGRLLELFRFPVGNLTDSHLLKWSSILVLSLNVILSQASVSNISYEQIKFAFKLLCLMLVSRLKYVKCVWRIRFVQSTDINHTKYRCLFVLQSSLVELLLPLSVSVRSYSAAYEGDHIRVDPKHFETSRGCCFLKLWVPELLLILPSSLCPFWSFWKFSSWFQAMKEWRNLT